MGKLGDIFKGIGNGKKGYKDYNYYNNYNNYNNYNDNTKNQELNKVPLVNENNTKKLEDTINSIQKNNNTNNDEVGKENSLGLETKKEDNSNNELFWDPNKKKNPVPLAKPIVDKKMIFILLEDSKKSKVYEDLFRNGLIKAVEGNLYTIVYYDDIDVIIGKYTEGHKLSLVKVDLEGRNLSGGMFYEAIKVVKDLALECLSIDLPGIDHDYRISSVEIYGIGNAYDTSSNMLKEEAASIIHYLNKNPNITTKYSCIFSDRVVSAAELGFRSIGTLTPNYY